MANQGQSRACQVQERQHSVVDLVTVRLHDGILGTAQQSRNRTARSVPFNHVIPTLESLGVWLSLACALLNERPSLLEGGREITLHQESIGEELSFPAAQDTAAAALTRRRTSAPPTTRP
jgi:hypothetical protein